MAFSQSNITSGYFLYSKIVGENGFLTDYDNSTLYYTINSGENWIVSDSSPDKYFNTGLSIIGTNGSLNGVSITIDKNTNFFVNCKYTTNSGATWTLSNSQLPLLTNKYINNIIIDVVGSNVIMAVWIDDVTEYNIYLFYSTDGGNNWTQTINLSDSSNPFFISQLSGLYETVCTQDGAIIRYIVKVSLESTPGKYYLYVSNDGGQSVTMTHTITQPNYNDTLSMSGSTALYCVYQAGINDGILYRSVDGGFTWNIALTTPLNHNMQSLVIDQNIAIVTVHVYFQNKCEIYYSSDFGATWNFIELAISNVTGDYKKIGLSGNIGLLSLVTNTGTFEEQLYYTNNGGASWLFATNLGLPIVEELSVSNSNAIVSTGKSGVYYTSTLLCYEKNTLILIKENDIEVYKKVCELKVGDLVKTYKHDYKKIKIIKSFKYLNWNRENELNYLYRMKENGVILTGGHSILVDELSEQEKIQLKKIGFSENIEDKKLLLACISDKFEKIDDDKEYDLCHFSLENDNPCTHYGVYINDGILSESCPEKILVRL